MENIHLSASTIGRKAGRSSVAAAAYRCASKYIDERTGVVHDFTKKKGVLFSQLILPGGQNVERGAFWNSIEKHHKRGDAIVAREIEISLPKELNANQRQKLAVEYGRELAQRYGVAADVALHAPRELKTRDLQRNPDQYFEIDEKGKIHNANYHAHIMLSACSVNQDGTLGKKCNRLDPIHCRRAKIENAVDFERRRFCEILNQALTENGIDSNVDHRSYEARGIDRLPQIHLGSSVIEMAGRGIQTERKQRNDEIKRKNAKIISLCEYRAKLEREIEIEQAKIEKKHDQRDYESEMIEKYDAQNASERRSIDLYDSLSVCKIDAYRAFCERRIAAIVETIDAKNLFQPVKIAQSLKSVLNKSHLEQYRNADEMRHVYNDVVIHSIAKHIMIDDDYQCVVDYIERLNDKSLMRQTHQIVQQFKAEQSQNDIRDSHEYTDHHVDDQSDYFYPSQ